MATLICKKAEHCHSACPHKIPHEVDLRKPAERWHLFSSLNLHPLDFCYDAYCIPFRKGLKEMEYEKISIEAYRLAKHPTSKLESLIGFLGDEKFKDFFEGKGILQICAKDLEKIREKLKKKDKRRQEERERILRAIEKDFDETKSVTYYCF